MHKKLEKRRDSMHYCYYCFRKTNALYLAGLLWEKELFSINFIHHQTDLDIYIYIFLNKRAINFY